MHADTLYNLAAIRGRDLEAAAARTRRRSVARRDDRFVDRATALLHPGWAGVKPAPSPVVCCA